MNYEPFHRKSPFLCDLNSKTTYLNQITQHPGLMITIPLTMSHNDPGLEIDWDLDGDHLERWRRD